jgi:hypothetical protein
MSPFTKNLLVLVVAAGAAGALGTYAYFGVLKTEARQAAEKAEAERILPSSAVLDGGGGTESGFTSLTVSAKGARTDLVKDASGWRLTSPVQGAGDAEAIEGLLRELAGGRFKTKVEEKPTAEDLQRYGLATPSFEVTASGPAGRFTLKGGAENPYDGSVYAQRDQDPTVYALPGAARFAFQKGPSELRDKRLFPFDPAQVQGLDVQAKAFHYTVQRQGEKGWALTSPAPKKADAEAVEGILDALKDARALSYTTEGEHSVNGDALHLVLTLKEGTATFSLDEESSETSPRVYARRELPGEPTAVMELPSNLLEAIRKPLDAVTDKALVDFDPHAVTQTDFLAPNTPTLRLQRETSDGGSGDSWRVTAPVGGPAKQWKMASVLWLLKSLKAKEVVEDSPKSWEKYGLGAEARVVVLKGSSGQEMGRFWIGKTDAKSGAVFARGEKNQVVQVESDRLAELPKSVSDVLDSPASQDGGLTPKP